MDITKPYKSIGFGDIDVTKPYKFIGFGALLAQPSVGFARRGCIIIGGGGGRPQDPLTRFARCRCFVATGLCHTLWYAVLLPGRK
jgi:hypothetical protein